MKTLNIKKIIYALTLSLGLISLESLAASCTANANFNQTNPAFECDPLAYTNGGTYTVNNAGNIGVGNVVTYSGIYINGGSYVSTVTNTGSILGEYAFWVDTGHVGTITNGSTTNSTALIGNIEAFSSPSSGYSFDTINNYGSINSSGAYTTAIYLSGAATLNIINNYGSGTIQGDSVNGGSYSGAGNAIELESGASINAINNSGLIKGVLLGSGIYLGSGTSIGTITNNGSSAAILGGSGYYGINNFAGTITTLNNGQGGTATHTSNGNALTYYGTSPQNYNIIITSTSQYGQLVNYSSSGSVTFGISSLSTKGAGVLGNYSTVLNGITSANLGLGGATTSGTRTSNGYTYTLNETGSATNIWDLILTAAPSSSTPSYTPNVLANNNPAAVGAANSLTTAANNSTPGLGGVITTLNGLSGAAQSNAISQTLPTVVGSSSLAAASSQRSFNQIIQARQNVQVGLSSGEDFIANGDVWLKGFGGWANQNDQGGVSGYKVTGSGLAIGADHALSPRSNIGAVFAFGNSSVTGNNTAAPSDVTVASYQAGVYGDYAIDPVLNWNYQADAGFNNNQESRNLAAFAGTTGVTGTTASASYNSVSEHIGTGLRYLMPLTDSTNFLPALRVDYTSIQSKGYTENGAGSLNLNVNSQTYNELLLGADLRVDQELVHTLKLSANVGVGYNTLNNQVQITSSYMGGGSSFVTNGLAVSPWLYNAGLGLSGKLEKNMELAVRYDVQATTTGYTNQMASAKLKVFF